MVAAVPASRAASRRGAVFSLMVILAAGCSGPEGLTEIQATAKRHVRLCQIQFQWTSNPRSGFAP